MGSREALIGGLDGVVHEDYKTENLQVLVRVMTCCKPGVRKEGFSAVLESSFHPKASLFLCLGKLPNENYQRAFPSISKTELHKLKLLNYCQDQTITKPVMITHLRLSKVSLFIIN